MIQKLARKLQFGRLTLRGVDVFDISICICHEVDMLTTLTLEPDVAQELRKQIAEKKLPLKRIVNDALRAGLSQTRKKERATRFTVEPHSFGFKPGIDRDKLGQLVDELVGEEFLRKHQR